MSIPTPKHLYKLTSDINDSIGNAHFTQSNDVGQTPANVSHSESEGMTFDANGHFNTHLRVGLDDVGLDAGNSWSISFWFKAPNQGFIDDFFIGTRAQDKWGIGNAGGGTNSKTLHIHRQTNTRLRYGFHGNDKDYSNFQSALTSTNNPNFTSNFYIQDYVHWVIIYDNDGPPRKNIYINNIQLTHNGGGNTDNAWQGDANGIFTIGNGAYTSGLNSRTLNNQKWLNLAIFDTALTSSQVQNIYNTGKYYSYNITDIVFPLDVSLGIVSWYNGDSYDTSINKWVDKSITFDLSSDYLRGNVIKKYNPTTQTLISNRNNKKYYQKQFQPYLSGDKNSGITFSNTGTTKFLSDVSYTFFHVARRNPIENNTSGRIFDGSGVNWYSGFNDASTGVALHDTSYINIIDKNYGQNWVVSVDRPNYYRSVGYSDTSNGYYETSDGNINSTNTNSPFLTIHNGNTTLSNNSQQCEWNVAEVISYNRLLQLSEENKIFNYLKHKYLGTNDSTSGELYQLTGDISANKMIKGYPPEYPRTQNIIGWYTPESYHVDTSFIWSDISPYKNDLSGCGTPTIKQNVTHANLSYLKGTKGESYDESSGFLFPKNFLPSDGSYTLIHVARRVNDCSGRIIDSSSNVNFYSGFVDFKSGVALHSIDVSKSL
tara:strand:- start:6229 stop:8193 length:1965 start_codon:yes stop_codon:yes gene_type:complete